MITWKNRIFNHQQWVRETAAPKQISLFDVAPVHCDVEEIDPFTLQLFPLTFHDFAKGYSGDTCIYFVLDCASKIILYIGETKASNLRWDGQHYCKDYVSNYVSLHRKYKLDVAVNIAFWGDVPSQIRARQKLETELIYRWQSPFNKQMWEKWGQPFGK